MARSERLRAYHAALIKRQGLRRPDVSMDRELAELLVTEMIQTAQVDHVRDIQDFPASELINAATSSPGGLQFTLDRISEDIEEDLARAGFALEADIYVSEFPTGSFNALAMSTSAGVLVLINTGLMMMIHQIMKILSYRIVFTEYGEDGTIVPIGEPGRFGGYSQDETIEALTEIVVAYLRFEFTEGSTMAKRFPTQFPFAGRGRIANTLTHHCEYFVVAHEYGHIIDGHLKWPETISGPMADPRIELAEKKWNREFVADALSVNLMFRRFEATIPDSEPSTDHSGNYLLDYNMVAVAPLLCLAIHNLVSQAKSILSDVPDAPASDHPPSAERMLYILGYVRQYLGEGLSKEMPKIFEFSDALLDLMASMSDAVLVRLQELSG